MKKLIGLFSTKGKTSKEVAQEAWWALQRFNQQEHEEQTPKPQGAKSTKRNVFGEILAQAEEENLISLGVAPEEARKISRKHHELEEQK